MGQNYGTPQQLQQLISPGIDYFGKLGMSEGLQNLALQDQARQNQLASSLGQNAGNQSLLNVLRSQGGLQMGLAQQPLYSQAQQGTFERGLKNIDLQNQLQQLQNATAMQQAGFNQQANLSQLQARASSLMPNQNLLEALSNLSNLGAGTQTINNQVGQRNYS